MTEKAYKEHQEFLQQVENDEREHRRKSLIVGGVMLLVLLVVAILLGMAGLALKRKVA